MPWPSEILSDCVLVGYDCRVLELVEKTSREIVGYVICRSSLTICHILNLCVSPESQGKGYGSQLLTAVLETLKSNRSIPQRFWKFVQATWLLLLCMKNLVFSMTLSKLTITKIPMVGKMPYY